MRTRVHQVYYLVDISGTLLLYVGRSTNPNRRKRRFSKLHGINTNILKSEGLPIAIAQELEREEIKFLRPPFNKRIASGLGMLGLPQSNFAKAATRQRQLGVKLSPEHREAIGAAQRGVPKAQASKDKLSRTLTGRKLPLSTKHAMHLAILRRKRKNLPVGGQCHKTISPGPVNGSWRDKFLFGEEALLAGKKLSIA